jgi:cytochrome P450
MSEAIKTTEPKAIIDFDPYTKKYTDHGKEILDETRQKCPVAWSEHHGGFWLFSRYDDVSEALSEYKKYSSEHDLPEEVTGFPQTGSGFRGVAIPEISFRYVPSEADPPLSTAVRKLETPFFTPAAVEAMVPSLVEATRAAIDAVIETGQIEFSHDLAKPVPYRLALSIVGIDPNDWEIFAVGEGTLRYLPTDPKYPHEGVKLARNYLLDFIAKRRCDPAGDLTSALITGEVLGKGLTDPQIATILNGLVFAGSHTVTATLLYALVWLDYKPELRKRLLEDESLLMNGIDEFIRWVTPLSAAARNVAEEMEKRGQRLHRGDRVMASMVGANHDPEKFECPHEVQLDRKNANQHVSFGVGLHRCTGATLARLELKTLLTEILTRLPDYRVDHSGIICLGQIASLNTLVAVPASFTPGKRRGPA